MSSSSPSDLAVTFRSIPRRLREALGDTPPAATAGITAELNEQIGIAAGLLHTTAQPDAIASRDRGGAVGRVERHDVGIVRGTALDIGRLLRAIAAVAESDDE